MGWLELFPEYKGRELFLTSESYGGHYVPAWAHAINDYNEATPNSPLNLKGLVIGNGDLGDIGLTEKEQNDYYSTFLKAKDLLPQNATPTDMDDADAMSQKYIGYAANYYDYRIKDLDCPTCQSYNYSDMDDFINAATTRTALHACGDAGQESFGPFWPGGDSGGGCINFPSDFDKDDKFDYLGSFTRCLEKGIRVSFYMARMTAHVIT